MPHGHHHHGPPGDHAYAGLPAETLALAGHWDELLDWVAARAPRARAVVDLGAGTGIAAVGLARRLPAAQVTAVDASDAYDEALMRDADRLGVASRVRTVVADLDGDLQLDTAPDLLFASNCLHHVADPGRVLRGLAGAVTDDGLMCVVEVARPMRFLTADSPAGAAERRAWDLVDTRLRAAMPTHGGDWPRIVADSGWEVVDAHEFTTRVDPGTGGPAVTWATDHLRRVLAATREHLAPDDVALLDDVVDRAGRDPAGVGWDVDGSRIAVLARPARTADTR
ncbi:class I SAM-dependent methyltransferase [Williamsia deligens]|uniref:Class I SAM-dependent methyltransferase n=1 Tax=Williamsia deligens TaxID=321325 RepID=A0ABW3G897_9NOCA|nr:class I SAM-dependent methyltransferase [Williamsia deligens]